jgi:hypothetical protein
MSEPPSAARRGLPVRVINGYRIGMASDPKVAESLAEIRRYYALGSKVPDTASHVFLLEATHTFRDGTFDFALGLHQAGEYSGYFGNFLASSVERYTINCTRSTSSIRLASTLLNRLDD